MTIKRIILIFVTLLVTLKVVLSVISSFSEPQVQSRLELYQTNLILQGSEIIKHSDNVDPNFVQISRVLWTEDPLKTAAQQYQKVKETTENNLATLEKKLTQVQEQAEVSEALTVAIAQMEKLLAELDLEMGILQASQGNLENAFKNWQNVITEANQNPKIASIAHLTQVINNIWQNQPVILPETESLINDNLHSWFRYRSLEQLYQVQNRKQDLLVLNKQEAVIAEKSLLKLAFIGGIPVIYCILGVLLLLGCGIELILKREKAILATNSGISWEIPWNGETTWQGMIVGFFFVGQFILPLLLSLIGLDTNGWSLRLKAVYILVNYLLLALGTLFVIYLSLKPFLPLPENKDLFNFKWSIKDILWGIGGYLAAIPLVLLVSLINQQFWQGNGGSNPLLSLALESQDKVALIIFFSTAAIAAPLFEEIVFRGFFLPSLTRYIPVWSSILISALVFAIAHLSVSEILPLTTLGIILGFIYTRSRNLLSSMLLHSLWNSGTLITLYILGS